MDIRDYNKLVSGLDQATSLDELNKYKQANPELETEWGLKDWYARLANKEKEVSQREFSPLLQDYQSNVREFANDPEAIAHLRDRASGWTSGLPNQIKPTNKQGYADYTTVLQDYATRAYDNAVEKPILNRYNSGDIRPEDLTYLQQKYGKEVNSVLSPSENNFNRNDKVAERGRFNQLGQDIASYVPNPSDPDAAARYYAAAAGRAGVNPLETYSNVTKFAHERAQETPVGIEDYTIPGKGGTQKNVKLQKYAAGNTKEIGAVNYDPSVERAANAQVRAAELQAKAQRFQALMDEKRRWEEQAFKSYEALSENHPEALTNANASPEAIKAMQGDPAWKLNQDVSKRLELINQELDALTGRKRPTSTEKKSSGLNKSDPRVQKALAAGYSEAEVEAYLKGKK